MKTSLLLLKQKDTEKVKWRKGISTYLQRVYGQNQWNQFYDEKLLKGLDHLRDTANSDLANEVLLEQNYTYYGYLEQLYLRLGNASSRLNMDFVWYEANYTEGMGSMKYSQHNIVFEKACTLFNIGCLLIQVANDNINDDYKVAIANISKAAGCFEYISENFLNSPSVDLQSDNNKFLAALCHAEAQELFLQKLINGPDSTKQASLVSKLAVETARLYEKCSELIKNPESRVKVYGTPIWETNIHFKHLFYQAVATYYHSITLEGKNKIGEAIGFLNSAKEFSTSSQSFKIHVEEYFDVDAFNEIVEDHLRKLVKDNDYIYHETVPATVQLETIKSMDAIKILPLSKQLEPIMTSIDEECNIIFKGIVPMDVYEKESIYSESKATLLRHENEATEIANLSYTSFIEFTNLPTLLNDLTKAYKTGNFSSSDETQVIFMRQQIESWIQLVQSSELKNIEKQMENIVVKRNEILNLLKSLPDYEKDNVVKLKSSLIEASQSDDNLFSLVKPFIEEIDLLDSSSKVWQIFNSFNQTLDSQQSLLDIDDTENSRILSKINKLFELSENLKLLKEERQRNLEELKQNINEDDITTLIIKNISKGESELKHIFDIELEKFNPLSTRIEATIFKQTSIINEIKIELDDIFKVSGFHDKSFKEKEVIEKRRQFFEKLREAITNFSIFSTSFTKGFQFYDSLIKMSNQLKSQSRNNGDKGIFTSNSPPPLQPRPSELDTNFGNMKIGLQQQQSIVPTVLYVNKPGVPIPTQPIPNSNGVYINQPPVPPKNPMGNQQAARVKHGDERTLRQNPTAFYNNPSVFDENLYSKFSE